MATELTTRNLHACFGGTTGFYTHSSTACNGEMNFSVYVPPQADSGSVPVLYFLSGLTCTDENFMAKAGAQRYAAQHGLMLVAPDTSPRQANIPGEDDHWDFGTGAGFYVDATVSPWSEYYRMYRYVVDELPQVIADHFPADMSRQGVFGHSMGGHGALVCGLRNPDQYRSISAFAPIAAPSQCPWGQKAFTNYLGDDASAWAQYDASQLVVEHGGDRPILIDQGTADSFLEQNQLLPEVFEAACRKAHQPVTLRMQPGYDHGYYFISSFVEDHIAHHARALCQ
ncbi:MAG: S-formylglutathione hydrolase [Leptolyngbyaceae bacterium]|nr:S-formylglutathione hydrolase [Leptolyngbyaceae bacterium]